MTLRRVSIAPDLAVVRSDARQGSGRGLAVDKESDELVIERVLNGDVDAFQILVERHQRPLYACAWQVLGNATEAEEALQEALVQAFMKLHRLRERRYFLTWAWRICTTVATKWRVKTRRQRLGFETNQAGGAETPVPSATAERDRAVVAAMGRLPVEQREAVTLRYWEGMDYQEMSRLTGVSEVALYQRVSRALKAMRKTLGEEFLDGEVMSGHEPRAALRMPRMNQDE